MIFRLRDLLSSEVSSAPGIVESNLSAFCHVEVNEIQFLIVLVSEVHRVAIPETEVETLCLLVMICHNSHKTVHYGLYLLQLN